MKTRTKRLPARFAPATRFTLQPTPAARCRRRKETIFEELRSHLLGQLLISTEDATLRLAYERAGREAAALAWLTPYPHLFFPMLLEEKAEIARHYTERQKLLLRRSRIQLEAA